MDHNILFFFTSDYDYRPSYDPGMIIAYRAGTECEVTEECASRAATSGYGTFAAVAEDDLFDIADDGEDEA